MPQVIWKSNFWTVKWCMHATKQNLKAAVGSSDLFGVLCYVMKEKKKLYSNSHSMTIKLLGVWSQCNDK